MVGEKSPEFASGQILYCLKMSRLNYVVKETPYSVYITVRKTFIKDEPEVQSMKSDTLYSLNSDTGVELNRFKERNKDLETRLELAKVEFEEMELVKETMTIKLSKQDDDIESFLSREKGFKEQIDVLTKHNEDMKGIIDQNQDEIEELEEQNKNAESDKSDLNDKLEALCKEISDLRQNCTQEENVNNKTKDLEKKLSKTRDDLKSANDDVLILENTLDNRKSEIESLKEKMVNKSNNCETCDNAIRNSVISELHIPEHTEVIPVDNESVPTTSQCGKCEFESDDETELKVHVKSSHAFECEKCDISFEACNDLKVHMGKIHGTKCDECGENFANANKLKTHTCRIYVKNPTDGSLYMKNWYIVNECIRVFCDKNMEQVAILHSRKCKKETPCPDFPPEASALYGEIAIDENNIIHLDTGSTIEHKEVEWDIMHTLIYATDHITVKSAHQGNIV